MKKMQCLLLLFCLALYVEAEVGVPGTSPKIKANARLVAGDLKKAPEHWKKAPLVYYRVPAISPVKRLPDSYPDDGHFLAPLRIVAARGEFEPASIVVYPFRKITELTLTPSMLRNGTNTIPASALDIKVVKIWYQQGSSWYGFYNDRTQRVLTPELLLHDENLVKVDHRTKDNYVRYKFSDGTEKYTWMSFSSAVVNHSNVGQANYNLIADDSRKLLPVSLFPGEFKQFFVTMHVPETAAPGIYRGKIFLAVDGKNVGDVPVLLRVLPFKLPKPATYYNVNKEFYGALYCDSVILKHPGMLRDLAEHNILNPILQMGILNAESFKQTIDKLKTAGLSTAPLFGMGPYLRVLAGNPPDNVQKTKLDHLKKSLDSAADLSRKITGRKDIYCYGYDEGGPSKIYRERRAWRLAHEAGLKTMVTSYPYPRILFNLDLLIIPGMPNEEKKKAVDMRHAANPDSLVGWYADPHSGPENPAYFRRLHGMMAYKSNYDAICNYIWFRNNWNDFWVPQEPYMRGLMMVYPTKDNVIDTLAWEGVREGMDDIRYATELKRLALNALRSKNTDTNYVARKALSWLADWDAVRADLSAGKLEMINYILSLRTVMNGGK